MAGGIGPLLQGASKISVAICDILSRPIKAAAAYPAWKWGQHFVIERVSYCHGVRLLLRNSRERGADGDRSLAMLLPECRGQRYWVLAGGVTQLRSWAGQWYFD